MYGRGRYNRQGYNRGTRGGEGVPVRVQIAERLGGWLLVGGDYYDSRRMSERLSGEAELCSGSGIWGEWQEHLTGDIIVTTGIEIAKLLAEDLEGSAHLGGDIYLLDRQLAEQLHSSAHMGADIFISDQLQEAITGLAHMGADIYILAGWYETLNGYLDVGNVEEVITAITGTIPPGSLLVVDSETYNVLLNGQSIIARHERDWITIGRDTLSLTLSGIGSSQYQWEVMYTAQYL